MTAAARKTSTVSPARRAMLAKVHLAAKKLGLRDEERRDVLERLTGNRSSADCTDAQLDKVLTHYRSLGWNKGKPRARQADHPSAKKARALWISLHQLGAIRNAADQALEAFARRQLKVERLQWADQGQVYKLIEALKAIAERAGWSQDLAGVAPPLHIVVLKRRLLAAMHARLGTAPPACSASALDTAISLAAAELRSRAAP